MPHHIDLKNKRCQAWRCSGQAIMAPTKLRWYSTLKIIPYIIPSIYHTEHISYRASRRGGQAIVKLSTPNPKLITLISTPNPKLIILLFLYPKTCTSRSIPPPTWTVCFSIQSLVHVRAPSYKCFHRHSTWCALIIVFGRRPRYCSKHAPVGYVNIVTSTRCYAEGCRKRGVYGEVGVADGPLFCNRHR
jgi:hypothetical protein